MTERISSGTFEADERRKLDELVTWARDRGVTSLTLSDGTHLDIGPEPFDEAKLTDAQRAEREKARLDAREKAERSKAEYLRRAVRGAGYR